MSKTRRSTLHRALLVAAVVATVLVGVGQPPASATHVNVWATKGLAYGYQAKVVLTPALTGIQEHRGYGQYACTNFTPPATPHGCANFFSASATPSVELPSTGGNLSVTDADGSTASAGPAQMFSAGSTTVSTQGSTGTLTSSSSTTNNNINIPDLKETLTATQLTSQCNATTSSVTGSATITGGTVKTDSGLDVNDDGDFLDVELGEHGPVVVAIPDGTIAQNTQHTGHVHLENGNTDTWTYVFNEHVLNPDGTKSIHAAHQYLHGPNAIGDLLIGTAYCGVATTITLPTNADRRSDFAKSAGSDTTYFVLNDLATAFNESQGCENYKTTYGPPPDFDPNALLTCAADTSQPHSTVNTENYDHDVVTNYFPTGSTDGFRQLCRREATSVQNIQFARSSSNASVQAPNCTTANGGDAGTVFRWVTFASENLGWAYWTGGHSVTDLTVAQLNDIFVDCTITNWNQLGGPNEPIRTFAPLANSGSLATWQVLLGGNPSSCIPAAFKDGEPANGERLVREHHAVDVEVIDTTAEATGLGTCAGQPGCATANLEQWSIFAGFSCAVWNTQLANRSASLIGNVAGQDCASPTHAGKRNMYNVFAQTPGAGYPAVNPAVRRFTDMRSTFPPGNPTVNGYLCMPLSKHSKPVGNTDPGTAFAGATKNYGMEKQAVLVANGFNLHKNDAAYQPGGTTNPDDKPFCKMAEWSVGAGNMTFTGTQLGLPSGA